MTFATAHPALAEALAGRGYDTPTSVQQAVLDAAATRDLLVSAQTGSGKTVAFGLAAASSLLGSSERLEPAAAPLALVIAPTRELALQVREELGWLYAKAGARTVSCVGGMDPKRERSALAQGCHIVVGTPGRLRDHLERGQLDMGALRIVVLDEADEMLDLGFREDLEFILAAAPPTRRTLMFSATIAKEIASLARRFQTDALRIDTARRDTPHGDIDYRALRIAPGEVERATVNVLRYYDSDRALVFCATRDAVRHMHASLQERGFAAVALSGELSQAERSRALSALRDGRSKVCIATDVASRGLDLASLDLVVHADLPGSREALLHRSGRTGRAGRKGTCIVLVPADRQRRAQTLFTAAGIAVQWEAAPSVEAVRLRDEQRMLQHPAFQTPATEELDLARRLLADREASDVVAVLLRLVCGGLPMPEELSHRAAPVPYAGATQSTRLPRSGATFDSVRFRIGLGRHNKADPKWMLPLICRLGGVGREDIGRIEIGDRVSIFEVAATAAALFRDATRVPQGDEPRITEVGGMAAQAPHQKRGDALPGGAGHIAAAASPAAKKRHRPPGFRKQRQGSA